MGFPFVSGRAVYLRPVELSDAERFLRWLSDPEINRFLLAGRWPINHLREEEFLREQYKSKEHAIFAICLTENDIHVGACGLHGIQEIDRHATAGIFIGERSLHGKGLGTEAMRLLLGYAFGTLNLRRVVLGVFEYNARAVESYRKLGFKEEGRLRAHRYRDGAYHDEIVMGILREELVG